MMNILKKFWMNKVIRISIILVSLLVVIGLLVLFFPRILLIFTPLSDEDRHKINEIENRIDDSETLFNKKMTEYSTIHSKNENDQKALQGVHLKILRAKISLFKLQNNRIPNEKEIKKVLQPVPVEPISGSSNVSLKIDSIGGWYYNSENGAIGIND